MVKKNYVGRRKLEEEGPRVQVKNWRRYADLRLDLFGTGQSLTPEAKEALMRLILDYIKAHWKNRRIRSQYFTVGEYTSFLCHREDAAAMAKNIKAIALAQEEEP